MDTGLKPAGKIDPDNDILNADPMLSFLAGVSSTVNQTGANKKKKRKKKKKKNENLLESINFSEIQETSRDNGSGLGVLQDYDLPHSNNDNNDSFNDIILPTIDD